MDDKELLHLLGNPTGLEQNILVFMAMALTL